MYYVAKILFSDVLSIETLTTCVPFGNLFYCLYDICIYLAIYHIILSECDIVTM